MPLQKYSYSFLVLCFLIVTQSSVFAQAEKNNAVQDTTKEKSRVEVVNTESLEFRGDLNPPEQHYKGNVKMVHDSIYMFSDTVRLNEQFLVAIGEISIIQADTIYLFADSMIYVNENKLAKLFEDVVLQNGNQQIFTDSLFYNAESKFAVIPDTTILQNKRTKMRSQRATYDVENDLATFIEEVVVHDVEFTLTADSLLYNTKLDKAIFTGPTNIIQEQKTIYCESGYYLIGQEQAQFGGNPIYKEDSTTAIANLMIYDGVQKKVTMIGDAKYVDEDKEAIADKITYFEETKDVILEGNAWFKNEDSEASGDKISYNEETGKVDIDGDAQLNSTENLVSAAIVKYNDQTEEAVLTGNAYFFSKEDSTSIFAHEIIANDVSKEYKAYGDGDRPYMVRLMDADSLLLSADTLLISERIDSLDTIDVFRAYNDVRILGKEFQAISDSLYYDSQDSIFTLFKNPIMWSDSSQFRGDTIKLFMGEDGIEKIEMLIKSSVIEFIESNYYNQINAKYITAIIDSSEIKTMHMVDNAESNYYILDDEKAYIGLNHTLCKKMDFYFTDQELDDIKFYYEPTSLLTPMDQVKKEQLFLDGFNWQEESKPKSLEDLLKAKKLILDEAGNATTKDSLGRLVYKDEKSSHIDSFINDENFIFKDSIILDSIKVMEKKPLDSDENPTKNNDKLKSTSDTINEEKNKIRDGKKG